MNTAKTVRLTYENVERIARAKGFDFFPSRRRGSRYTARPNHYAIFRRDPGPWGFHDLATAQRFFDAHEGHIATRIDWDVMRYLRSRRAAQPIAA